MLKHIFLVNNHISCLMALRVIAHEQAMPSDILMLSVRGYRFPDLPELNGIRKLHYGFFSDVGLGSTRRALLNLLRIGHFRSLLRMADRSIVEVIGSEKFRLYAPHSKSINVEILTSMPQCVEYSFVEEGTLAYAITPESNIARLSSRERCYNFVCSVLWGFRSNRMTAFSQFDIGNPKFRMIYCCREEAFRGFPNRICLGLPFGRQTGIPGDLTAVMVFDGGIVTPEQQLDSLEKDICHAVEVLHCPSVYFKFHPAQKENVRQSYRIFFKEQEKRHQVSIKELPDEVVLENLAFSLKDKLSIYIICSSVGVYALLCGSRIFSTAQRYVSGNQRLQRHFDTYGYIFSKYNAI